jgi:DNA-binding transcriptional ArsR family regulator
MPAADTPTSPGASSDGRVHYDVGRSLAAELLWAVMVPSDQPGRSSFPQGDRLALDDGLAGRVRTMWGDGVNCFAEVIVLAHRAGLLFEGSSDRLIAGLDQAAREEPRFELLESETPQDQARFRARLVGLHEDDQLRERWLMLLSDVWAVAADGWESEGLSQVEVYGQEVRGKLSQGTYADLAPLMACDFAGLLPRLVQQYAAARQPVTVIPSWFSFKSFVVSLSGVLVLTVPIPVRPAGPTDETRNRARRFKALSDPTRLAILESSARRPRTIGELAREMAVAQPTVSNHVRILRDAGLLQQLRDGSRRFGADPDALRHLTEESLSALSPVLQD